MTVVGMGCGLDTMRLRHYVAEHLLIPAGVVDAYVIGAHNDTMLPLWETARVGNIPLLQLISESDRERILESTRTAGDRIVQSLGRGSSIAAGVLGAQMVASLMSPDGNPFSADCCLHDCFGVPDTMISLPCILRREGPHVSIPPLTPVQRERLHQTAIDIDQHAGMVMQEEGMK